MTIEPNAIGKKGVKTIRIKGEGLPAGKDGSLKGDLWVAFEVVSSSTQIPPIIASEVVSVQHMFLKCRQTYKLRKQVRPLFSPSHIDRGGSDSLI